MLPESTLQNPGKTTQNTKKKLKVLVWSNTKRNATAQRMPAEHDIIGITAELPPPEEPKRKDKKWRPHPRKGALTKRGPPRPYRRISEEVLATRIQKLTTRMERAKKQVKRSPSAHTRGFRTQSDAPPPPTPTLEQHESSRQLLTKYSHEKTYRLRESLQTAEDGTQPNLQLPEFQAVDSSIQEPPNCT